MSRPYRDWAAEADNASRAGAATIQTWSDDVESFVGSVTMGLGYGADMVSPFGRKPGRKREPRRFKGVAWPSWSRTTSGRNPARLP
jgi:hypothetical protein